MFGSLVDSIDQWLRELLAGLVGGNLSRMFTDVNEKVGSIATEVGKSPSDWNNSILTMLKNLSETAIVSIAAMIVTYVLCYELISLIIDRNNMKDFDTFIFFKYIAKMCIAVYLLSHTFDIALAIFDLAQNVISNSSSLISSETSINVENTIPDMLEKLKELDIGTLIMLWGETGLLSLVMTVVSIIITVILYGRMVEVYFYISVAPIPFSTLTNREWGSIGNNYIRALFALGFQAFFIMVAVAIYSILIDDITIVEIKDIHGVVLNTCVYTVLLVTMLFKTHSISKSIFNAH